MPLNRTNQTVFGTVIQYATTGQIDPLTRWYGLNNHSLTINQYGWINGTGTFGVSTGGVTPQFDVNGAFTTGYIAALAELTAGTLKIGTSSNTENYIAFRGTTGDIPGNFDHGFIGERLYGGTESSELLLFKGNDVEGISGPDRIRLLAANHVFDTYTAGLSGSFSTVGATTSNVYTRMIIKQNGNIGIGTTSPDTIGSSSVPAMLGIVSNAVGTVGLVVKLIASQTANLQEWQNSTGTVLSYINQSGQFVSNVAMAVLAGNYGGYVSQFISSNSSYKGILVKGAASQTANLQEWQNSSGTTLTSITANGVLAIGNFELNSGFGATFYNKQAAFYDTSNTATYVSAISFTRGNTGGAWMNFGTVGDSSNGVASIDIRDGNNAQLFSIGYTANAKINLQSASSVGLIIKGAASQTADLQQWQNSSGSVLSKIDAYGRLGISTSILSNSTGGYSQVSIASVNTTDTNLIIKGYASQSANLQEWQDSSGTVLAKITAAGAIDVTAITVNGSPISTSSIPAAADVELMSIMGAY